MKTSTVANAFVIANVVHALPNLLQDVDRAILAGKDSILSRSHLIRSSHHSVAVERRGTVSPRDAPILTGRDDDPVEPPPIGGGGTLGGGSGSGTVTITVNAFTCSNNAVCCKRAYDDGFTTIHCSYYNKAYPTINNWYGRPQVGLYM